MAQDKTGGFEMQSSKLPQSNPSRRGVWVVGGFTLPPPRRPQSPRRE
jgi:hypothetical protein